MFSARKSSVRQDFELGNVFSTETKSWACFGDQELGRIMNYALFLIRKPKNGHVFCG